MPDDLRTDKALFKEIVQAITPDVPYADRAATATAGDILKEAPMSGLLLDALRSEDARRMFSSEFLGHVTKGIAVDRLPSSKAPGLLRRMIPRSIKNILRDTGIASLKADPHVLAFRVYIMVRMHQVLIDESHLGRS